MPDPVEVARIRAYLETHLKRYHWEALRDKLIAEGYTPEAVDLALTQVESARAAMAVEETARTRVASLATVLTLVNVVLFGCVLPAVGLPVVLEGPGADRLARVLWWGLAPILAGQLIALAILFIRQSPLARPLLSALLPSLALALLLFGGCILTVGQELVGLLVQAEGLADRKGVLVMLSLSALLMVGLVPYSSIQSEVMLMPHSTSRSDRSRGRARRLAAEVTAGLAGSLLGAVLGLVVGALIGGNLYGPSGGEAFVGMYGYEATGWVGLIVGVIRGGSGGIFGAGRLSPLVGSQVGTLTGSVMGVLVGAGLLVTPGGVVREDRLLNKHPLTLPTLFLTTLLGGMLGVERTCRDKEPTSTIVAPSVARDTQSESTECGPLLPWVVGVFIALLGGLFLSELRKRWWYGASSGGAWHVHPGAARAAASG